MRHLILLLLAVLALLAIVPAALGNYPPVAVDDVIHSPALPGPFTFDVLANDSDPDGDPLTIVSVTGPTSGQATVVGNKIRYTPGLKFSGSESGLRYTISDGHGGTAVATLTLTNRAPVAVADSMTVLVGAPTVIPVLANDSDPDGDPLTITSAQCPWGTATIDGDHLIFTTSLAFWEPALISYTISDGRGASTTATVTVRAFYFVVSQISRLGSYGAVVRAELTYLSPDNQIYMEYGPTREYGLRTSTYGDASSEYLHHSSLTNLLPGRTYHYRFVLQTSIGTYRTQDATFTTRPPVSGRPALFGSRSSDRRIVVYDDVGWQHVIAEGIGGGPLVYAPDGNLYAADTVGGTIWRIAPDETVSAYLTGLNQPSGFGFLSDGSLVVAVRGVSGEDSTLLKVSPTGARSEIATNRPLVAELVTTTDDRIETVGVNPGGIDQISLDGTIVSGFRAPTRAFSIARVSADWLISATRDPDTVSTQNFALVGHSSLNLDAVDAVAVATTGQSIPPSFFYATSQGNIYRYGSNGSFFAFDKQHPSHLAAPRIAEASGLSVEALSSGKAMLRSRILTGGERVSVRFRYDNGKISNVTPWVDYEPSLAAIDYRARIENLPTTEVISFALELRSSSLTSSFPGPAFRTPSQNPVAVPDVFHQAIGSLDVVANDPRGAMITSVEPGRHGATVVSQNQILYTKGPDFDGDDSFTYSVVDAFGDTTTTTVTLYNNRPQASDDTFIVSGGKTAELAVLQNDWDVDGDPIRISSFTAPSHGRVESSEIGLAYTPDDSFRGGDSFTYTISDGFGKSATATVRLQPSEVTSDLVSERGGVVSLPAGEARLGRFGIPTLNDAGDVAFTATVSLNGQMRRGVLASYVKRSIVPATLAISGELAPGLIGGRFRSFADPLLDAAGHVAFLARATMGDGSELTGLWSDANAHSQLSLVAIANGAAPVLPVTTYRKLEGVAMTDDGTLILLARMRAAAGRDQGLFVYAPGELGRCVLRMGDSQSFSGEYLRISSIAPFGALAGTADQRRGFNGAGDLLVRVGAHGGGSEMLRTGYPLKLGASFFEEPTYDFDAAGAPASWGFQAIGSPLGSSRENYGLGTVARGGPAYYRGGGSIYAHRFAKVPGSVLADNKVVARVGDIAAGVPGANLARFQTLGDPVGNTEGDVAFFGTIGQAKPFIDASNDRGVWFARDGETPRLLIREGDKAPGVPGAVLTSITSLALPGERGIVFTAEGAYPQRFSTARMAAPFRGLWAQDHTGEFRLLVRTGAGDVREFTALAATPSAPSQGRTANATGGVVARITRADLTQAIRTFWLP